MQVIDFIWHKFSITLLLGLLSISSWSQEGQKYTLLIIDEDSYQPVLNAVIQSVTSDGVIEHTDSNGLVTIDLSVKKVVVSSIQYNSKEVKLNPDSAGKRIIIKMTPKIMMLEQTVVSASREDKPLKNTSSSIERIKPELLQNRNSLTVKDGLIQVPGVSITDNQVNIRNGSGWSYGAGSRVMVMVDDMPMLSGDAVTPLWTFINTENIESVEVIKGASSVLFGSSALTGVVNIKTKKPDFKPVTEVFTFYGAYNKPRMESWEWTDHRLFVNGFSMNHRQRIGKYGLNMGYYWQKDDGYRMGDKDDRTRINFELTRSFFNDHSVMGLRSQYMRANSSSFLLWQNFDSAFTALNNETTETDADRYMIDYNWRHYTRNDIKFLWQSRFLSIDNRVDNGDPDNDQSNSSITGYTEFRVSKKWTRTELHGGYLWQGTRSRSPLFQGRHTTMNQAPYAQLEWRPLATLTYELGGRYEFYKLDDATAKKPVFRTGLNLQAGKYRFIRASFGQGYRFPTIGESFIKTSVGPVTIYPNEDLRPETGWNAEVGIKQGLKYKNLKLVADLAGFWMEYQDMMEFIFTQWSTDATIENALGFGFKSLNVGNTRIRGLDLSVLYELKINDKSAISGFGGYTYTEPIFLEPENVFARNAFDKELTFNNTSSDTSGSILKYRYQHMVKFGTKYEIRIKKMQYYFGVNVRYNSYMQNIDGAFVQFPINLLVKGVAQAREKDENGKTFIDVQAGIVFHEYLGLNVSWTNIFNQYQMNRPADISGPGYFLVKLSYTTVR